MNFKRQGFGVPLYDNSKILVCGGRDDRNALNIFESYDISTNKWTIIKLKIPTYLSSC